MTDVLSRMAGAPITWGVDGSPGWGHLMNRDRVLAEMHDVGLKATELGPDGYLPTDPDDLAQLLRSHELQLVGGFVPAVLYREDMAPDQLAYVSRAARTLAGCGAQVMVLGPDSHLPGYDTSIDLSESEWRVFLHNLKRVVDAAAEQGLTTALHQHWGMAVEQPHHLERVLAASEVPLCLDTGHLHLGGVDPAELAREAAERVVHVHLKDVDSEMAERVRRGSTGFRQAVIDGMFRPLGEGSVDIAGTVRHLEAAGYRGWYVLEQDVSLTGDPPEASGPVVDAAASLRYLERVAAP